MSTNFSRSLNRSVTLKVSIVALALIAGACSSEQKVADPNAKASVAVDPDLGLAKSAEVTSPSTAPAAPAAPTATPVPSTEAERDQDQVVLPKTLQAATNSSYRSVENSKRDQYRHPLETLKFFGVQPKMTVVEITPGAGWYTEILAPFLANEGQYIGAFPTAGENAKQNETTAKVIAWLKSHREFTGHVTLADFQPPTNLNLAPDGTADMVLTFRNVHNWLEAGTADAVFAAFFKALKPGGILGIEDHRANPAAPHDPKAENGYVLEKDMIALAAKAGFKLVAKSEINANKKDTKDYADGVWTLPPTLRLKDQDRAKYLAIGESDRMTLKFMKPLKAKSQERKGSKPVEVEKRFKCPYCFERISMLLDCSEDGTQEYIEDCEVCCQPIQVIFESRDSKLISFTCLATQ